MKELILRKDLGNQAITVKSSPSQHDVYLFKINFETPEQCVKYVQSKQWRHQNNFNVRIVVCIVNFEQIFFGVSFVEFKQVSIGCLRIFFSKAALQ